MRIDPVPRMPNNSRQFSDEQNARLREDLNTGAQLARESAALENAGLNRPFFSSVIPPIGIPYLTPPCDFPPARARFGVHRKGLENALRDANDNVVNPAGLNFLTVEPKDGQSLAQLDPSLNIIVL